MTLNWFQSKAMRFPCYKITGAVDAHTTTLFLSLDLVLSKPKELSSSSVSSYSSGMRIHK